MRKTYIILSILLSFQCIVSQAQEINRLARFSLNQSFQTISEAPDVYPYGIEMEYLRKSVASPLGYGFSMGYQSYGHQDHTDFRTSHSIYKLDFNLTLDLFNSNRFRVYSKGSWGINRFVTRTFQGTNEFGHFLAFVLFLLDDDEDDEDNVETEPLVILKRFSDVKAAFSGALGFDWNIDGKTSFFFESGFRPFRSVLFVEKSKVVVDDDDIIYEPTTSDLALLSFSVGLTFSF